MQKRFLFFRKSILCPAHDDKEGGAETAQAMIP